MIKIVLSFILVICIINVKGQNTDEKEKVIQSIQDLPAWTSAISAYKDGLSDVAVEKLEKIESRSDLSNTDKTRVRSLLVENLVRTGRYQEALDTAKGDELNFWRGIALAALGKANEARPLLDKYIKNSKDQFHSSAVLSISSAYESLGMLEKALEVISTSVENSKTNKNKNNIIKFKLATINLLLGNYDDAIESTNTINSSSKEINNLKLLIQSKAFFALSKFTESESSIKNISVGIENRTPKIHTALENLKFNIQVKLENFEKAIPIIRSAIENAPIGCDNTPFFEKLLSLSEKEPTQVESLLSTWTKAEDNNLSRKARYFLIKLNYSKDIEKSILLLKEIADGEDSISLKSKILHGKILIINKSYQEAIELLNSINNVAQDQYSSSEINFLLAEAHNKNSDIRSATESYLNVKDPTNKDSAKFNAALIEMLNNEKSDNDLDNQLISTIQNNNIKGNALLERGLLLASDGSDNAKFSIEQFIDQFPKHERIAEAHLAIASLLLQESPTNYERANKSLITGKAHAVKSTDKERADYLDFWISENSSEIGAIEVKGNSFLEKWPNSSHSPEIRMRLGEIFYINKDYSKALLNFEKLYTNYPNSELATRSMYFAAHSAKLTLSEEGIERALNLFENVAKTKTTLAPKAILESAQIKLNENLNTEAIDSLDSLIDSKVPNTIRITALMLKGKALYEQGALSADKITDAINAFDMILSIDKLSTSSRNEAIFRKAKSYEFIGQDTKSLELYYQILTAPRPPLTENEKPEMNWHFKSGFECIRILTSRNNNQDLRAAIIIADQLASINGTRSLEAKVISERLKLENFIWDE